MSDSNATPGTELSVEKVIVGQKLNLTKAAGDAGLQGVTIAIGWDENKAQTGDQFDADVTVVLAREDETAPQENVIFFGQLTTPDGKFELDPATGNNKVITPGYITHWGDNRTGAGEGDDESVDVDLTKIAPEFTKVIVYVSIFEAGTRNQVFGMLNNAFIRIDDKATSQPLAKLELDFDADTATSLRFGTLNKKDSGWFFIAEKTPQAGGIKEIIASHVK